MKLVVYTAIFNKYDFLHNPLVKDPDVDYVCFTDDPQLVKSRGWDVRLIAFDGMERKDKHIKLFANEYLPEYDASIWVDGNIIIKKSLKQLFGYIRHFPLALYQHPFRSTLKQEFEICKRVRKADLRQLKKQQEAYADYLNYGIEACGVLIRRHNDQNVIKTMQKWWEEMQIHTYRDQLSFPVACEATNLYYKIIYQNLYESPLFTIQKMHRK